MRTLACVLTTTLSALSVSCAMPFPLPKCAGDETPMRWYVDQDTDGWGGFDYEYYCPSETPTLSEYDHVTRSGDCNDTNSAINPDAQELCSNEWDDNCDSKIDESGKIGPDEPNALYYASDGDCVPIPTRCCPKGLVCSRESEQVCQVEAQETDEPALAPTPYTHTLEMDPPAIEPSIPAEITSTDTTNDNDNDGFTLSQGDCNDQDSSIHPGAIEKCEVAIADQDCDGVDDEGFVDVDGDGSCSEWIYLPPTSFEMGSPASEVGRDTDEPLHSVRLAHGLFILSTEVTVGMYNRFMDPDRVPSATDCDVISDQNLCPLNYVSWSETLVFANALTTACNNLPSCRNLSFNVREMTQAYDTISDSWKDPDGSGPNSPYDQTGYRLPTEAEWEYAIRATLTESGVIEVNPEAFYSGLNSSSEACLDGGDPNLGEIAWYLCNAKVCDRQLCASQVGQDPLIGGSRAGAATELGIYDLSGNLYEWVWDQYLWYHVKPYYSMPPEGVSLPVMVIRGGSYYSPDHECRSASRHWEERDSLGREDLGFRVVRSAIADKPPWGQSGGALGGR